MRCQAIRIVLDITRLVEEGKLTAQEAERLQTLAKRDTGSLAISVLMSFGAVAVAAGIIALEPTFTTGAALGVVLVAIGLAISFFAAEQWGLLGTATTVIGALLLAGGVIGLVEADFVGLAFSALLFLALAVEIRSGFLMALVPLALAGALGSSTGYRHAVYMLTVTEPTITIAFFALLAGAAYLISKRVRQAYQQLAIIFARVSLILVNFGFWIGSLWGDYPGQTWAQGGGYRFWSDRDTWRAAHLHVPEIAFIVGWAIVIIAVGAWAARVNRRWVVTTAAVFAAIEFYTQWFERLGAEPWAIIIAGLTVVAIAIALWRYNLTGGRPTTVTA
jgi:iron complex transport system permease protein